MSSRLGRRVGGRTVEVSRPEKVLFPEDGLTKTDLVDYYIAVGETMLPHVRGRPVAMRRFPDGIGEGGFFEKKAPQHFPDWIDRVEVQTRESSQRHVVCNEEATLAYLADQACVEPHVWLSREDDLDHPDQLIIDLDPSVEDLRRLRAATRAVGSRLEDLGLTPFVKTTGSRGYHVHVPLDRGEDFDTVREFARSLAETLADGDPDLMTTKQRKDERGDRVFLDDLRNAYGQNAIPAYGVRARPGAPVATPIDWSEVGQVAPDGYDMTSVLRRLSQKADPWQGIAGHACSLDAARRNLTRGRGGE